MLTSMSGVMSFPRTCPTHALLYVIDIAFHPRNDHLVVGVRAAMEIMPIEQQRHFCMVSIFG